MNHELSKSQFKPRVLELLREVERTGEPLIVTDHGQPVIEIRRYTPPHNDPLARLRCSVKRYDDPFAPVGEAAWEAGQ